MSRRRAFLFFFFVRGNTPLSAQVQAKFSRGNPAGIEACLILHNPDEWHRFMRFMRRYADQTGLEFTAADGGGDGKGGT